MTKRRTRSRSLTKHQWLLCKRLLAYQHWKLESMQKLPKTSKYRTWHEQELSQSFYEFKNHFRFQLPLPVYVKWKSVETLPWSRMKPRRQWHRSMKGWTCEWNNMKCVFWESKTLPNNWMNLLRIHVSIQVWQGIPKVWKLEAQFLHLYRFEFLRAIWFATKLKF